VVLAWLSALALPVGAQTDRQEEQTDLQNATEAAVRSVCASLKSLPNRDPIQEDLFVQCASMVNTANEKDGVPFNPDFVLDISDGELRGAWQNLAGEEFATQGTMGTKISAGQFENVTRRLIMLRTGVTGFSVADLRLATDGQLVSAAAFVPEGRTQERGGAASADDPGAERWGVFLNGVVGFGDRDPTDREDGFDVDTRGVTLGVDYRVGTKLVIGGALGFGSMDADLHLTTDAVDPAALLVEGGNVEVSGSSGTLYLASFGESFYFDLAGSYGQDSYDLRREVNYATGPDSRERRTALADPDGSHYGVTLGGGYDRSKGSWSYGPYLRVSSQNIDIDGYVETGSVGSLSLEVDPQEYESLISILGLDVSKAASQSWGVLLPQLRAEWNHEFKDDSQLIRTRYFFDPDKFENGHELGVLTDEPDRDFFIVSLSLAAVFRGGNQAFINYDSLLDYRNISNHVFTLGLRFSL
jgi:outer membrane autotransporter protein